METSLFYWCVLYLSYVLLPVIPAVIIYRNFPDTTVGVSGILSGLKINATGAFGGYIITAVLGMFIIKKAFAFIEDKSVKTWTVTSKVRFLDENDKPLTLGPSELESMSALTNVVFTPPPDSGWTKSSERFQFKIPSCTQLPCVRYSYSTGEYLAVIDLDSIENGKNNAERKIDLGTVYLKKSNRKYQPDTSQSFVQGGPPINR